MNKENALPGSAPVARQPTNAAQYPKGDLRRMLSVLVAISAATGATLVQISTQTGLDKRSVMHLIAQAEGQAAVKVAKAGPLYTLDNWGPLFTKAGVTKLLTRCV